MTFSTNSSTGAAAAFATLLAVGCSNLGGAQPATADFAVVEVYNVTDATLQVELREDGTVTPLSASVEILPCQKAIVKMNAPPPRILRAHAVAKKVKDGPVHGVSWPITVTAEGGRIDLQPVDFGAFLLIDEKAAFDLNENCRRARE